MREEPVSSAGQSQTQTQNFTYDHLDRMTKAWTTGNTLNSYNSTYSYDAIGNLTNKGGTAYSYPASGSSSVHPHAVSDVGGSTYDSDGNLTSGGGRTYI